MPAFIVSVGKRRRVYSTKQAIANGTDDHTFQGRNRLSGSFYKAVKGFIPDLSPEMNAPADLSTDKQHLQGFGE